MIAKLSALLLGLSATSAYVVVFLLMALQSACIPIPSEVIMPFAGYKLGHSMLDLVILATIASLASNLGSIPAYYLGANGGRPMIEKFGRYILLNRHDLDLADKFFAKFGSLAVLIGRMLPIVRTFIAFPAGIARMNQVRFHLYTFIGSWPWCFALAYIGMKLGASWDTNPHFKAVFHRFQLGVEVVIVVGFVWFVWTHWKNRVRTDE
ncbi:DedA family protein [Granulicella cerasi]|uniref:DedA family protein n=1 Tax=Granulicella cerasi TaxID=741063 RepID=A0ABW1Z6K6_9BACT|nr:DedA family protein [Granulicella cerasi]